MQVGNLFFHLLFCLQLLFQLIFIFLFSVFTPGGNVFFSCLSVCIHIRPIFLEGISYKLGTNIHLFSRQNKPHVGGWRSKLLWPHIRTILMNMITTQSLERMSSHLGQMSAWAQGWTLLDFDGQRSKIKVTVTTCPSWLSVPFLWTWYHRNATRNVGLKQEWTGFWWPKVKGQKYLRRRSSWREIH